MRFLNRKSENLFAGSKKKNKEDVYFWREIQAVEDKQAAKIMAERETLAQRLSTAVSRAISAALANQPISVRIVISSSAFCSVAVYFLSTVMNEFAVMMTRVLQ